MKDQLVERGYAIAHVSVTRKHEFQVFHVEAERARDKIHIHMQLAYVDGMGYSTIAWCEERFKRDGIVRQFSDSFRLSAPKPSKKSRVTRRGDVSRGYAVPSGTQNTIVEKAVLAARLSLHAVLNRKLFNSDTTIPQS